MYILKKIQLSFFVFLPFLLLTGPFLPDLAISFIGFSFLIISLTEKKYKYFNIFFYIFIIWCLYLISSSLFSKNILLSLESSIFYFRFGFFVLGAWYVLDENTKSLKYFSLCLFLVFLLGIIDGYCQFFFDRNILGQINEGIRLSIFGGNELILGSFFSRLSPIFFVLSFYYFNKNKFFLILLCLIIMLVDILIFASGERTAFFLLTLSVVLIILMMKDYKTIRLVSFLISLFIIFFISISSEEIKDRMVGQTFRDIFALNNSEELNDLENNNLSNIMNLSDEKKIHYFSNTHEGLFESALIMFITEKNYFFGIGPKVFRYLCQKEDYIILKYQNCSTHPHNTYVQLLVETGIVGLLSITIIGIYVLFKILKQIYYSNFKNISTLSDIEIGMYSAVALTLWPFVPTGSFFNNWLSIVYFLPLPFLFYFNKNKQQKK